MAITECMHTCVGVLALWFGALSATAQKPASVETPGLVWEADLAAAHAASARDGKPVVAYFTFET